MDADRAVERLRREAGSPPSVPDLFRGDPDRPRDFCFSECGILLDLSGNPLTREALGLLCELARARGVVPFLRAQFTAARLNGTEDRPACHPVLRAGDEAEVGEDAREFARAAIAERERLCAFAEGVRSGEIRPSGGKRFREIVHLGTGGSHWPARLLHEAFERDVRKPRCHFVATVDPVALGQVLRRLDPRRTLVTVASKSFATRETLANAGAALGWLQEGVGKGRAHSHLAGVTAAPAKAEEFGVPGGQVFRVWDWVGGRYSATSSCALPAVLALGPGMFREFLAGARDMDLHVREAPERRSLPVLAALARVWLHDFLGHATRCVLAYGHPLRSLADYCQQLVMESCGKGGAGRCEVVWGGEGPVGEHSFHQFLLQGGVPVAVETVSYARPWNAPADARHKALLAHCIGQGLALRDGRTAAQALGDLRRAGVTEAEADRLAPHLAVPGSQPVTAVMLDALTPRSLGALVALQEHAAVAQAALRGVNPFDQWGVELGKARADEAEGWLQGNGVSAGDDGGVPHLARHVLGLLRRRR